MSSACLKGMEEGDLPFSVASPSRFQESSNLDSYCCHLLPHPEPPFQRKRLALLVLPSTLAMQKLRHIRLPHVFIFKYSCL